MREIGHNSMAVINLEVANELSNLDFLKLGQFPFQLPFGVSFS
jgi:hypothetical protein